MGARSAAARRTVALAGLVGACALTALAIVAFARPDTTTAIRQDAYRESGEFAWRAPAVRGTAFPNGVATTGEAVFLRLSRKVHVSFAYAFSSPLETSMSGSGALQAILSNGEGWSRTLDIGPRRDLVSGRGTLTGTLNLARLSAIERGFERETGAIPRSYLLTVVPRIRIAGQIDGVALTKRFAPRLSFRMDAIQLFPPMTADGAPAAMTRSRSGSLERVVPASLTFAGLSISLRRARVLVPIGAAICIVVLLLAGIPLLRRRGGGPANRLRNLLGRRVVCVERLPSMPGRAVQLSDPNDLLHMADEYSVPVLVADDGERSHFGLVVGDVLYSYVVPA